MKPTDVKQAEIIVLFGAVGDLATRKLLPALFQLDVAGFLQSSTQVVGVDLKTFDLSDFVGIVEKSIKNKVALQNSAEHIQRFLKRLTYQTLNFKNSDDFIQLSAVISKLKGERLYYFSTAPSLFGDICQGLHAGKLIAENDRVVMEKPIGESLETSIIINDQVSRFFNERQIYRIDHYLAKETVLNLLVLRFANALFTNNWDRNSIDHVQITVAESVGIEGRWGYYDGIGQLRDMVQNHLLQILALIAMEPPADLSACNIRNEKLKVLKALAPINHSNIHEKCVRGQYGDGYLNGSEIPSYLGEVGANTSSDTETFVAIKAEIDNWRWSGVPFYLRTGKRLNKKHSEVVIYFKQQAHNIFKENYPNLPANKLTIRLQPDEGIELDMMNKVPGISAAMKIQENKLDLSFSDTYGNERVVDAYERLLLEVINGNQSLFVRRDEVEAAWSWADGIINAWDASNESPKPYDSGSWGPVAAISLLATDNRQWSE